MKIILCFIFNINFLCLFPVKWRTSGWPISVAKICSVLNFTFCWLFIMQWFLVNDQRDAQIPFYVFIFLFIALYTYWAHRVHRQERQIVSIQPPVTVTLCRWLCRVQVGSRLLPTSTRHGHWHRVTFTRGCIDTICLSWWWARCARNM